MQPTPPPLDPTLDPALIARVLQHESAAGHILILPRQPNQTPEQKLEAGYALLLPIYKGQAPLGRLVEGCELLVGSIVQFTQGLPRGFMQSALKVFRPHREGLTDASRAALEIKRDYPAESYLLEVDRPLIDQVTQQTDALLGGLKTLGSAVAALEQLVGPRVDVLYDFATGAVDTLKVAIDSKKLPERLTGPLLTYAKERYEKGVAKRKDNAARDDKQLEKLTGEAEQKLRDKIILEAADAFERKADEAVAAPPAPLSPAAPPAMPTPHKPR